MFKLSKSVIVEELSMQVWPSIMRTLAKKSIHLQSLLCNFMRNRMQQWCLGNYSTERISLELLYALIKQNFETSLRDW